jgi:geranylgeranyl diphosphate synthase type II
MSITNYLSERKVLIEKALDNFLPGVDEYPSQIHQAMRHSVFAGGKRIRPILTIASCEIFGGNIEQAIPTACAIECIHTYSLIHDDLPCMDDDDLRRGIPTCHKKFGEGIAVLAGDGLLTHAFQLLAMNHELAQISPQNTLRVIVDISKACSTKGLIGGQVIDLESENKKIDCATLSYIHQHKTGALLTTSLRSGAILGNASDDELSIVTEYGNLLGLVFQITDDLLDIEGDLKLLGKTPGKDKQNNKATFPALYGIDKSKKLATEYANKAIEVLEPFAEKGLILKDIANYVLDRDR